MSLINFSYFCLKCTVGFQPSKCADLYLKNKSVSLPYTADSSKMKFVAATIFVTFCFAVGVDSGTLQLPNNGLTINGNANVQFYGDKEDVWAGLSNGRRYPLINSGDYIALRLAYTSGSFSQYWLLCYTSYCAANTCPGVTINSSEWSSCDSKMIFRITAMGKMDGQPINSGDTVSLSSKAYGTSYRLFCSTSTSYKCRVTSSTSSLSGNSWLTYNYLTFQIFSRSAVDGTPVQFNDIVAFKYSYGSRTSWLYYNSYFYAAGCTSNNKLSCAVTNSRFGFRIFKKI